MARKDRKARKDAKRWAKQQAYKRAQAKQREAQERVDRALGDAIRKAAEQAKGDPALEKILRRTTWRIRKGGK
jgi:regulator of protease activity HflC (stomatin/prohibitin superfamily)